MKICDKCGAYNSDERIFCVDCSEKLGDKLSAREEAQARDDLNEKLEEMYNKKDPLYVSKADKVMGIVSLLGALCSVVLVVIGVITGQSLDLLPYGIIFFILASIEAFVPEVTWEFEKLRLSFYVHGADDVEPSEAYFTGRKIAILFALFIGTLILVTTFLKFKYGIVI